MIRFVWNKLEYYSTIASSSILSVFVFELGLCIYKSIIVFNEILLFFLLLFIILLVLHFVQKSFQCCAYFLSPDASRTHACILSIDILFSRGKSWILSTSFSWKGFKKNRYGFLSAHCLFISLSLSELYFIGTVRVHLI